MKKLIDFVKHIELLLRKPVRKIRSDNDAEFPNQPLEEFLTNKGISQNILSPYNPQQNDFVERRNRSLHEAVWTILSFANLPLYFWVEAIGVACFTKNHAYMNKRFLTNPYEILNNYMPDVKFFLVFGCR